MAELIDHPCPGERNVDMIKDFAQMLLGATFNPCIMVDHE